MQAYRVAADDRKEVSYKKISYDTYHSYIRFDFERRGVPLLVMVKQLLCLQKVF